MTLPVPSLSSKPTTSKLPKISPAARGAEQEVWNASDSVPPPPSSITTVLELRSSITKVSPGAMPTISSKALSLLLRSIMAVTTALAGRSPLQTGGFTPARLASLSRHSLTTPLPK